jgi:hypothetical protein
VIVVRYLITYDSEFPNSHHQGENPEPVFKILRVRCLKPTPGLPRSHDRLVISALFTIGQIWTPVVGREGEDQRPIAGEALGHPHAARRESGTSVVSCQWVAISLGSCRQLDYYWLLRGEIVHAKDAPKNIIW